MNADVLSNVQSNVQLFPLWKVAVQESCCDVSTRIHRNQHQNRLCVCGFILGNSNVRVQSPDLVDGHSDIYRVAECSWSRSDVCPYMGTWCLRHTFMYSAVLGSLCVDSEKQRPSVRPPKIPPAAIMRHHEVLTRHGLGHHLVGCITPSAQCASRLLALLAAFSGTQSLIPDIDCSGGGHTSACYNFAHKPWKCESVYSRDCLTSLSYVNLATCLIVGLCTQCAGSVSCAGTTPPETSEACFIRG